MTWRFRSESHSLNPEGIKVEGQMTLYRIVGSAAHPEAAFFTDYARGFRQPRGSYQRRWPLLMHSLSTFLDPRKAADVAGCATKT